ncbi:MAG: hypothetical protein PVH37_25490 [Desulfobacterales bacterium]|jgi:hypothetical protein
MNKIENLKKIKLSWLAGTSQDTMNLTPKYPGFEFIFGLGSGGMTPFEYELVDKHEGQSVLIHLKKENLDRFFEHLNPPLLELFDVRNHIYLKVRIDAVTPAENREIIKAMADMAAHGGTGCDCGCGCGG